MIGVILRRKMPFYAVRRGKIPGVYHSWDECKAQVDKFQGPVFKKFNSNEEAEAFVQGEQPSSNLTCRESTGNNFSNITPTKRYNCQPQTPPVSSPCQKTYQVSNSPGAINKQDGVVSIRKTTLLSLKGSLDKIKQSMGEIRTYVTQAEEVLHTVLHDNKRPYSSTSSPDPIACDKRQRTEQFSHTESQVGVSVTSPVTVYTDGACTNNGFSGAKAGIGVYWGPNDHRNVSERLSGRQTNNRAEIYAATTAVRQAKRSGIRDLIIKTDSKFLINCITKWIIKWKKNGWVLSNKGTVQNREELEELDNELKCGIKVQWVHVPGHQGVAGNEEADRLANAGASMPPVD